MQSKAPLSTHRLFPAIVGLWCAALFGLGSWVLPHGVVERIVLATGLPSLIPAAQAPLGLTARMLIALCATGAGIAVGLILARQIARVRGATRPAEEPGPRRRRPIAESARRPLYIKEELGDESAIAPPTPDQLASDPLPPATEPYRPAEPSAAEFAVSAESGDSPAQAHAESTPVGIVQSEPVAASPFSSTYTPVAPPQAEPALADELQPGPFRRSEPVRQAEAETPVGAAAIRQANEERLPAHLPLDQLGFVQLTERLAHSLRKRAGQGRHARPQTLPPGLAAMLGMPEAPPPAARSEPVRPTQAPLSVAPARPAAATPQPVPAVPTPAASTPPALHPASFELDDFGEDEVDFEFEEFGDEEAFSSLLDLNDARHPPAEPVEPAAPDQPEASVARPFDTPPSIPPAQPGAADRAETERALRSALGRLQGFSGAA